MSKDDHQFARMYERLNAMADRRGGAAHRIELVAGLHGRVVEVGCGNGRNFIHYRPPVTDVVAVEPDSYLRELANDAARRAQVRIAVEDGTATGLPLPDQSVDAVVLSLVLCSVDDVEGRLAEARRVLRPNGQLRFYEHVSADQPWLRSIQHRIAPYTQRYGGGCRPDRRTVQSISQAGFAVEKLRTFNFRPAWYAFPMAPHVLGTARPIATAS